MNVVPNMQSHVPPTSSPGASISAAIPQANVTVPAASIQHAAKLLANARINAQQPGFSQNAVENAFQLLKGSPNPIDTLKRILTSDSFAELNINASPELQEAFESFLDAIKMGDKQMLQQFLFQGENETKFCGELFDRLSDILSEMPEGQLKTAVSQLLRAFDCYATSEKDEAATNALLEKLLEILDGDDQLQLLELIKKSFLPENSGTDPLPDTVQSFLHLLEQKLLDQLESAESDKFISKDPAVPGQNQGDAAPSDFEELLQKVLSEQKPANKAEFYLLKTLSETPRGQAVSSAELAADFAAVRNQAAKDLPASARAAFEKFAEALEKQILSPADRGQSGRLKELFSAMLEQPDSETADPALDQALKLLLSHETKRFASTVQNLPLNHETKPFASTVQRTEPEKAEMPAQVRQDARVEESVVPQEERPLLSEKEGSLYQNLAQRLVQNKFSYHRELIKNEIIPWLLQTKNPTLEEPLSQLKQSLIRTQDGRPEEMIRQAEQFFTILQQKHGYSEREILPLRFSLFEAIRDTVTKKNRPADAFAHLLQAGVRSSASEAGKNTFQELLWNLVLKNNTNLPFHHFFLPINYEGIILISELWKNRKKEVVVDEEEEQKSPERFRDIFKLFLTFDISKLGYFESSILYSENSFSLELSLPKALRGRHDEIRTAIRSIIERNHMSISNMVFCDAQKPKTIPEIADSLA